MAAIVVRASIALLCIAWAAAASAQPWPSRPIRLVVPYSAGTSSDLTARQIAPRLGELLGQSVVVENRAGGGGIIGSELVAKAPADGYTLILGTSQTHATNSSLFRKLPYDPVADFAPVARLAVQPAILVAHRSLGVKTVAELVALARSQPGKLNFASTGPGTQGHLQAAMLANAAGIDIRHIPYKEASQAFAALMRGDVAMMFYPHLPLTPALQSGQLTILASTSTQRSARLPDVPTMIESGFPDFTLAAWLAIYAPAGTAPDIVERINSALRRTLDDPEIRGKLVSQGSELTVGSASELAAFTRSEIERYRKLVATAGLSPE